MNILISVLYGITCGCIAMTIILLIKFFLMARDMNELARKHNALAEEFFTTLFKKGIHDEDSE